MRRYFAPEEHVIDRLSLHHEGGAYIGRGFLRWTPDTGFRLDALVDRAPTAPPLPSVKYVGRVGVVSRADVSSIHMRLQGGGRAMVPQVILSDRLDLEGGSLSISADRVLFLDDYTRPDKLRPQGGGLYRFAKLPVMPDTITDVKRVGGVRVLESFGASGIKHVDRTHRVIGWRHDERHLELYWTLRPPSWGWRDAWLFAEAARVALSLASGQDVQLLRCEAYRPGYRVTEVRRAGDARAFDLIAPLHGGVRLDKRVFLHMARFIVRDPELGRVCTRVVDQLGEATRQRNWQIRDLVVATMLEAILRTVFRIPFVPGPTLKLRPVLERFRTTYLDDAWKGVSDQALEAHNRLRHRNAHPDWLTTGGGALSVDQLGRALDDVILLSHFYGCMLLALARYGELQPRFPKPHREWRPTITISRGSPERS